MTNNSSTGNADSVHQASTDLVARITAVEEADHKFGEARKAFEAAEGNLIAALEAEANAHETMRSELTARRRARRSVGRA